jgi:N-acetylglutamate synthase-like GNAT family acetyltransferase
VRRERSATMMNAAELLERGAIDGLRECVAAAREAAPHLNADALEIAGGIAAFAGRESPLSEAGGLGVFLEATPQDVALLSQFYLDRGASPRIVVTPLSSFALTDALAQDGYRPIEYQNVLVRAADCGERDARIGVAADIPAWAFASASGFLERDAGADEALVGTIIARAATMIPLEARVDGTIVATAAMDVRGELAGLHGASTMPVARQRGWHNVLILDRVARARELGARYVYGIANVGGASERNFRRLGFEILHTRTLWERRVDASWTGGS